MQRVCVPLCFGSEGVLRSVYGMCVRVCVCVIDIKQAQQTDTGRGAGFSGIFFELAK